MEQIVKENSLTPGEFIRLFRSVGWTPPCEEQVHAALRGSLIVFSVHSGGRALAMARIVGDGAMTFFIKDVAVDPEYQGKGLGRLLMSLAEDYIRRRLKYGWAASAELISAVGMEGFYRSLGFSDGCGTGMMKMIRE